jgi:hypothetical protein
VAHWLWQRGRKVLALALQCRMAEVGQEIVMEGGG